MQNYKIPVRLSEFIDEIVDIVPFLVIVGAFILRMLKGAKKQDRQSSGAYTHDESEQVSAFATASRLPRTMAAAPPPVPLPMAVSLPDPAVEGQRATDLEPADETPLHGRRSRRFSRSDMRRALVLGEILRPRYTE